MFWGHTNIMLVYLLQAFMFHTAKEDMLPAILGSLTFNQSLVY